LEDPNNAPLPATWTWTASPHDAPDAVEKVSIEFQQGVPIAVNGVPMDPVAIVELLNEVGARNAVGRIDLVENRFVGMKSRGCYETPGGTLLLTAHRELEALCLDRELMHFKQHIGLKFAEVVYFGLWFTPLREALQAFVASSQADVNGTVKLALYKGNIDIVGRQSESSLYRPDVASFTMGASYNQKDAEGFIRILGLPARSRALVKSKVPKFSVESAGAASSSANSEVANSGGSK
jgi:argininosuccinate synthase